MRDSEHEILVRRAQENQNRRVRAIQRQRRLAELDHERERLLIKHRADYKRCCCTDPFCTEEGNHGQ